MHLGCTRIDLLPTQWDVDVGLLAAGGWMGRPPRARGEKSPYKRETKEYPFEDPHDGCPGGWYRSRFVASVQPFLRARTDDGGRVANPLLDRCDDEFVIQCVLLLEREQDAFEAHALQVIHG